MIELHNIEKVYHKDEQIIRAVDGVDLSIDKGAIYGVIGFSGAGKSTLLRCVNLIERPTSGEVKLDGEDLTKLPKAKLRKVRRRIGMIFQHFNLLESKTVYQNVAFPLLLDGQKGKHVEAKVKELLDFVGLADQAGKYPDELSGGQKQRVGIARALVRSPEVLLCDEATSALDPQTTDAILDLLKEIRDQYKITILMITHEMGVIREICDRVAVMEGGKVIEEGSVFDIFSSPKHQTTKNFVSSVMNDKIPDSILEALDSTRHVYRITFLREKASEPILYRAAAQHNVEVNVLYGQITELQGEPFGSLIVEFIGGEKEIFKALHTIGQSVTLKEVTRNAS
ncbi:MULTISPECIES: methionine ABC transporter ATP-binding protein [Pontibacillus]|uniref:ATP-binding cassette domain-containing protein n=1 Tax=Pontibacillus chungwhensis TaxID=265426 RepID=A0ABY8V481_9BACI|nr:MULTISPECIES: ATP-binding cassette domain-containing protein [Pontibacillus]MCD5322116.1 ATP-binding cassette domain-containing protein [Pontibacillus sp. HN14]WIF99415.1 ATP-binding cassette domain-containing protein [Pontibacillus chungwhensis]